MRVILDGSACFEPHSAASKYFAQMLSGLSGYGEIQVEWRPPPVNVMSAPMSVRVRSPLTPSGRWFPEGKIKKWLSGQRRKIESAWWAAREKSPEQAIFHSFTYRMSQVPRMKHLQMMLDMILEKFPEVYNSPVERAMCEDKRKAIFSASRLIAISECSKKDLCEIYPIDPSLVDVIYLGVDLEFFCPGDSSAELDRSLKRPYFLQVGGRLNHKNFDRLLEAFASGGFARDYDLVSAGEAWDSKEVRKMELLGVNGRVVNRIKPNDTQLRALYRGAKALVYPSLYEGFGLPPLEAMACGTPVVTARASSIPEVVGDAALLFDPADVEDIRRAMERSLDPATARRLAAAGRARAGGFPWEKTVRETVEAYRKILKPGA